MNPFFWTMGFFCYVIVMTIAYLWVRERPSWSKYAPAIVVFWPLALATLVFWSVVWCVKDFFALWRSRNDAEDRK